MASIKIWHVAIIITVMGINMLPWILALSSKKVSGAHKLAWFVLSFLISWIGYLMYYRFVIKELANEQNNVEGLPPSKSNQA